MTRNARRLERKRRLEPTVSFGPILPPTRGLRPADGTGLYLLTADDALAATVLEAGGERHSIHAVDDWPQLTAFVQHGRCGIVLLDVEALPKGLEACLADLEALRPGLVVLVAAYREAAQRLIGLLPAGLVHRLLIKPTTVGVTRLLLDSAANRHFQLRDAAAGPFAGPTEGLTRRPIPRPPRRSGLGALAVAGLAVAGAGLAAAAVFGPDGIDEWRSLAGRLPVLPLLEPPAATAEAAAEPAAAPQPAHAAEAARGEYVPAGGPAPPRTSAGADARSLPAAEPEPQRARPSGSRTTRD